MIAGLQRAQHEAPRFGAARAHRARFVQDPASRALFEESEPSTLWPSRDDFLRFVDNFRAAYEFAGFEVPPPPDLPPTRWDDRMHREAQAAFARWEIRNARHLRERQRRGLKFFEPDAPADAG